MTELRDFLVLGFPQKVFRLVALLLGGFAQLLAVLAGHLRDGDVDPGPVLLRVQVEAGRLAQRLHDVGRGLEGTDSRAKSKLGLRKLCQQHRVRVPIK